MNGDRAILRGARRGEETFVPRGPSPPTGESEKGESVSAAAPSDLNRKRLRPGVQCEYRRAWAASAVNPGGVFTGERPAAEAEASPRSSERRSVEYAAEVSCENYVDPGGFGRIVRCRKIGTARGGESGGGDAEGELGKDAKSWVDRE